MIRDSAVRPRHIVGNTDVPVMTARHQARSTTTQTISRRAVTQTGPYRLVAAPAGVFAVVVHDPAAERKTVADLDARGARLGPHVLVSLVLDLFAAQCANGRHNAPSGAVFFVSPNIRDW